MVHDFGKKNLKDFAWILLDGLPEIHRKSGQFLQRFHETINQNHPGNHPSLGWRWMKSTVKNAEQKVVNAKWLIGFNKKNMSTSVDERNPAPFLTKLSCIWNGAFEILSSINFLGLQSLQSGEKTASHNPGSAGKKNTVPCCRKHQTLKHIQTHSNTMWPRGCMPSLGRFLPSHTATGNSPNVETCFSWDSHRDSLHHLQSPLRCFVLVVIMGSHRPRQRVKEAIVVSLCHYCSFFNTKPQNKKVQLTSIDNGSPRHLMQIYDVFL